MTQTTLSVDDTAEVIDVLRRRFPEIVGPQKEDICYATQNRQDAIKKLTGDCDLILVVGSPNSSNSTRLMELSQKKGVPAYLIDNVSEIQREWLEGKSNIGLTAGASAPEVLVEEVIEKLKMWGVDSVVEAPGIQKAWCFHCRGNFTPERQGAGRPDKTLDNTLLIIIYTLLIGLDSSTGSAPLSSHAVNSCSGSSPF